VVWGLASLLLSCLFTATARAVCHSLLYWRVYTGWPDCSAGCALGSAIHTPVLTWRYCSAVSVAWLVTLADCGASLNSFSVLVCPVSVWSFSCM
jgi:hypothetical protein